MRPFPASAARRRAAVAGLDVIMVEHRGVGLSRHDDAGKDLPPEALTVDAAVDDIAAVLDDANVDKAIVYGTSYGSYLAAGMGVRHPNRVHAMVLDSPLLSADDIDVVRTQTRRVLWDGAEPGSADLAARVRRLAADGVLSSKDVQLIGDMYGAAGPDVLRRQLDLLLAGRDLLWAAVGLGTRKLLERKTPYHHEPDLVERIAKAAHDAREKNGKAAFAPDPALATSMGLEPGTIARLMVELGFRPAPPSACHSARAVCQSATACS